MKHCVTHHLGVIADGAGRRAARVASQLEPPAATGRAMPWTCVGAGGGLGRLAAARARRLQAHLVGRQLGEEGAADGAGGAGRTETFLGRVCFMEPVWISSAFSENIFHIFDKFVRPQAAQRKKHTRRAVVADPATQRGKLSTCNSAGRLLDTGHDRQVHTWVRTQVGGPRTAAQRTGYISRRAGPHQPRQSQGVALERETAVLAQRTGCVLRRAHPHQPRYT